MRVVWSRLARRDLAGIFAYIFADDPQAARRILEVIKAKVALLLETPLMARAGAVEGTRELVITGTPYLVVYRVKLEEIQILRVLHGARRRPMPLT